MPDHDFWVTCCGYSSTFVNKAVYQMRVIACSGKRRECCSSRIMTIPESKLIVKRSTLPGAGKGLFTKTFIAKDTKIAEYKGTITTWKEVDHKEGANGYIYYVKRNYVIDAQPHPDALARYANDAKGLYRCKGISNNSEYLEEGLKVFIVAKKDIAPGEEILVDYGKEYWKVIRYNQRLEKQKKTRKTRKRRKEDK
jgi:uncharacterized protein